MRSILAGLLTLALAALLWRHSVPSDLEPFKTFLVGAPITIAFFGINFALGTFSSSAYKSFHSATSGRLVTFCFVTILVGISPVLSLAFVPQDSTRIGITAVPVSVALSFLLYYLAKRETDPRVLLKEQSSRRMWSRFLREYFDKFRDLEKKYDSPDPASRREMASHEWDWKIGPLTERKNPAGQISGIGNLALAARDVTVFQKAVQAILDSSDIFREYVKRNKVSGDFRHLYLDELEGLLVRAEQEKTPFVSLMAIDLIETKILELIADPRVDSSRVFGVCGAMFRTSLNWLERDEPEAARRSIIFFRLLWLRGLDLISKLDEGEDLPIEGFYFPHNLNHLGGYLKELGSESIRKKKANLLYLVLEGLGYQGCSAVKGDVIPVGEECVRILAQLGREARAARLECHWDRCAVLPHDHAVERIEWIMSWLKEKEEDIADLWARICVGGMCRIQGLEIEFTDLGKGHAPRWEIHITDRPHKEIYSGPAGSRELDYSDPTMLKEFTMLPAGSGLMVGPSVPIKFEETKEDERAGGEGGATSGSPT